MSEAAEVVLRAFCAVEGRDYEGLIALYHPEVEFHEASSLPYGGTSVGRDEVAADLGWLEAWGPLQPTAAERRMDPRVISDDGEEVVVLYIQRAVDSEGNRFRGAGNGSLSGPGWQVRPGADVPLRHRRGRGVPGPGEADRAGVSGRTSPHASGAGTLARNYVIASRNRPQSSRPRRFQSATRGSVSARSLSGSTPIRTASSSTW
jgi:uncharacterized protein